jgi:multicomponent Na+:H+ antiporter subunit F
MIQMMITIALILFAIAIGMAVLRIILGPSMPDRVLALDVIGVNLIASIAVISVLMNTMAYLEAILILGILSFIGTIAYSKFIERGVVVELKRDR